MSQLCLLLGVYRLDCTMEREKQRTNRKTKTDLYWTPLRDFKTSDKDKFTLKASLFCEAFLYCQKLHVRVKRT
jgi:hypothetical protein